MASGGEVDISLLILVEAILSAVVADVNVGKGETGEAAHVHLVGGKSGACADGVVSRALDVLELYIPVSLFLVADHGEHKGLGVVDVLVTALSAPVVGTGGNLTDTEAIAWGEGKLESKLETVFAK